MLSRKRLDVCIKTSRRFSQNIKAFFKKTFIFSSRFFISIGIVFLLHIIWIIRFFWGSFASMEMSGIKMKRKNNILGLLAALCLLGTGSYAWILHEEYNELVAVWKVVAKAAFEEALWMEVNKRAEIPFYRSFSNESGVNSLKSQIPDSVSVMTVNGFKKYKIDRKKYDQSLAKDTRTRTGLSTLFYYYPLSVDTLAMHWDSLMAVKGIYLNNQFVMFIRI